MWKRLLFLFIICSTASLSAETKVLAFAGSTRKNSVNKKLVAEAADVARQMGASVTIIDLKDYPIPFYDGDLEAEEGMPANVQLLRQLLAQNEVVLISSPQYNASISAVLKNALDWLSRNECQATKEPFLGKKFVIMSASPGKKGGAKGLIHLRTIIEDVGGTVQEQQFSLPNADTAFDEQGKLKDPKWKAELETLVGKVFAP